MAKGTANTRVVADGKKGAIEQHIIFDDSILPSAEELQRLKDVDETIIKWIMNRAEAEQSARHELNKEQIKLAKKDVSYTGLALWLAFFIAVVGMGLSALFIIKSMQIVGTIFGGVTLVLCVQSFLSFGRKQKVK